jgi:hypothetical protein
VPEPGRRALELARKSFGRLAAQIVRKGLTESDGIKPKALGVEMHVPANQAWKRRAEEDEAIETGARRTRLGRDTRQGTGSREKREGVKSRWS